MRTFRLIHRPTSDAELARVGLVLGPVAAEQLRRDTIAAQQAALRAHGIRWLIVALCVLAVGGWLWSLWKGGAP